MRADKLLCLSVQSIDTRSELQLAVVNVESLHSFHRTVEGGAYDE